MKNLLATFCFIISLFAYSQVEINYSETPQAAVKKVYTENFTSRDVDQMAILKECKSIDESNRIDLQNCLTEVLNNKISDRFSEFDGTADNLQLENAFAQIQFVLAKNGKIEEVTMIGNMDKQFLDFVKNVFEELKEKIEFEPAKIDDEKINLKFPLVVKYNRTRS